ncbi:cation:proton antiporter domain-containing protein [Phaeovulum vinaykumarii]|uniref:Kef-type potassium/proton antiporter, CPA2 family n=1 Tax=Phaeovulum vinaykumarii TaxID=407234 RepID=A0A1N7L4U7_9RHOB|nr:cation:proton antiporter [Phaeovulum vinaykumarii]SIS68811.1 Kef-type potassium/proton antiporter, CPA2 family [Phaeovulum vinaykumarii]SOB99841.1 Kef-type potassium/proton antiporter (CPA2 family) [Phaeovulum vinaykumarii]
MDSFLYQATLYLMAIVVAVPIAQRLGLGSVLGYLVVGLLIGPVFGLVGTEMNELRHVAEFGVVMMLFLIGLELEPRALWAMRDKLIGLGGLQVLITLAAVFVSAMVFNPDWRAALAMGMIFSLSSTAIVLQTLSEKKLMSTPGGRAAFSVLLAQDIAVIPMLALLPFLALPGARAVAGAEHGGHLIEGLPAWGVTLVTLGAVAGAVLAGHFLVRPLFRFAQMARLREVNTAMALVIVVGIASLMLMVGLSPALGTFLAGVMLADSEFKHELEASIEPFKGLLLGLFFITVGAGMDFSGFFAAPVLLPVYVLGLVGIKVVILYILARAFGLKAEDRWLFTLGLAQAGEFAFVLIAFAAGQRILPSSIAQMANLVVALSMLITPALFIAHELLARRMKRAGTAQPDEDEIDEQHPVIIAGMGRFGQAVNRMVTVSGFRTTVLDHDLKAVQQMRRFGFKAYFGDPTRPELLASAGIETARVLVVCLGDAEAATKLVAYARRIRPDLYIVARARDRVHVFELYRAGADDIVREVFDSSLRAARHVIEHCGLSDYEAAEAERLFDKVDQSAMRDLARVWKPGVKIEDNPEYMALAHALNRELETALSAVRPGGQRKGTQHKDDRVSEVTLSGSLTPEAEVKKDSAAS